MANTRRDSARERRWRGTLISGGYFIKLLTTNSQFAKPAENSSTAVLPPPLPGFAGNRTMTRILANPGLFHALYQHTRTREEESLHQSVPS